MVVRGSEQSAPRSSSLRLPAVAFLVVYCALLLLVPSQLILKPLGAPGTPANLWGLGGLLWWLCVTVGGLNPRGISPMRVAAGLLALAVLASYASAMVHGWSAPADVHQITDDVYDLVPTTVDGLAEKMISGADRGLLSLGGWLGVVLMTTDGLRSWRDVHLLARCLVWLGAIVAAMGVLQFFTGFDLASYIRIPGLSADSAIGASSERSALRRVAGTAIHPIEFGVVMAGLFPLALHQVMFHPRSKWSWPPVILIGLAIPMTVSRSAVLAAGLGLIIMFIGWPTAWRRRALLIFPAALIAMRIMVPGLVGTILSLFTNFFVDPSVTGRTQDYDVVFRIYADNALLGRGLFTFIPRYYRILDNQFLMFLVELGVIGFLVVLLFFLTAYLSARGARRRAVDQVDGHFCLALSGAIAGVVVSYATFDAFGFPMAAGLTFILCGIAGAVWQIARTDQPSHLGSSVVAGGVAGLADDGSRPIGSAGRGDHG